MPRKPKDPNATKKEKPKDGIKETVMADGSKTYWFQVMVNGERKTSRGHMSKTAAKLAKAAVTTELSESTKGGQKSNQQKNRAKKLFSVYFWDWLDERPKLAKSTRRMYISYFENHINPILGNLPLDKITDEEIELLNKTMRNKDVVKKPKDGTEKRTKMSEEMVKRVYSLVHTVLGTAETKEIIGKNPADKVTEKPQVSTKERHVWDLQIALDFLKASRNYSRYWIAVYLAVMTGMRQGEILALKWSNIDFDNGMIHVLRNLDRVERTFDELKTERSKRGIALSPQIIKELLKQKEIVEMEKAELGDAYEDHDLVVPTSLGTPAFANKVLQAFNGMKKKFLPKGAPNITFHDLRHTFASILLKQGEQAKVISDLLGHSTITITMNRYAHILPGVQGNAMAKMGATMDMYDNNKE